MKSELSYIAKCSTADLFNKHIELFLSEAAEKYTDMTLVMLDIDEFMHVNTQFGHDVGDEVLNEIAMILSQIEIAKNVYRYSGDEFAIIFPHAEKEKIFLLMEEVRKKIAAADKCKMTNSTISAGIATYPEDGNKSVEIIRKADGAMYRAKAGGRNKVALAKEEKLIAKTAHFTAEQLKKLKELSEETGIGEAALLREAADELFKKYDAKNKPAYMFL